MVQKPVEPKNSENPEPLHYTVDLKLSLDSVVYDALCKEAQMFRMQPSQYAKALLHKALGILDIAIDRRRRPDRR